MGEFVEATTNIGGLSVFNFLLTLAGLGVFALLSVEQSNDDDDSDSGGGGLMEPIS